MTQWFTENFDSADVLAFFLLLAMVIFAIVGLDKFIEFGLGGFTGFLSKKALSTLNEKKGETDNSKDNVLEQRRITDELLGEIEHEAQTGNLSGDDVATALNDVIARVRSRHS